MGGSALFALPKKLKCDVLIGKNKKLPMVMADAASKPYAHIGHNSGKRQRDEHTKPPHGTTSVCRCLPTLHHTAESC